jgi:hypothetical protein
MDRRARAGQLGCAARGDKELERLRPTAAAELAGQLEGDERSHAVAEESERFLKVRLERGGECLDQIRQSGEGRLREPVVAAG